MLLSLSRNPCSARRSLDAFLRAPSSWHPTGYFLCRPGVGSATVGVEERRLSLGPWIRPGPRVLYKTPVGKMSPAGEGSVRGGRGAFA